MIEYRKESGCFWTMRYNKRYAISFTLEQFLKQNKELIVEGLI